MNSNVKWRKIKSWNVGTPDGEAETYTLYEDEDSGAFRIANDFGNIVIDMERMSGREFLKRAARSVEDALTPNIDDEDWLIDDLDVDADCDSDSTLSHTRRNNEQFI